MPFLEHQFESLLPKPFLKKKMNRADLLFINILQQPTTHTDPYRLHREATIEGEIL